MHMLNILMDYIGITQTELAKRSGITAADLNEMINKEPYGMITKYQRLFDYLAVSVDCIVKNNLLRISESFFEKHTPGAYLDPISTKKAILGREAEEEVFQMEKARVMEFSPLLAKLVLPYYKMRATSPGYDILSYSPDGSPVYIEVKNSEKNVLSDFRLTAHEFEVATQVTGNGLPYLIYVFSGWHSENQRLEIKPFKALQDEGRITPGNYTCTGPDFLWTAAWDLLSENPLVAFQHTMKPPKLLQRPFIRMKWCPNLSTESLCRQSMTDSLKATTMLALAKAPRDLTERRGVIFLLLLRYLSATSQKRLFKPQLTIFVKPVRNGKPLPKSKISAVFCVRKQWVWDYSSQTTDNLCNCPKVTANALSRLPIPT